MLWRLPLSFVQTSLYCWAASLLHNVSSLLPQHATSFFMVLYSLRLPFSKVWGFFVRLVGSLFLLIFLLMHWFFDMLWVSLLKNILVALFMHTGSSLLLVFRSRPLGVNVDVDVFAHRGHLQLWNPCQPWWDWEQESLGFGTSHSSTLSSAFLWQNGWLLGGQRYESHILQIFSNKRSQRSQENI